MSIAWALELSYTKERRNILHRDSVPTDLKSAVTLVQFIRNRFAYQINSLLNFQGLFIYSRKLAFHTWKFFVVVH